MKLLSGGSVIWRKLKINNDTIAKRVYVGECAGSYSLSRPLKRQIDTVSNCLREGGLDVRQARIGVNGRGL